MRMILPATGCVAEENAGPDAAGRRRTWDDIDRCLTLSTPPSSTSIGADPSARGFSLQGGAGHIAGPEPRFTHGAACTPSRPQAMGQPIVDGHGREPDQLARAIDEQRLAQHL